MATDTWGHRGSLRWVGGSGPQLGLAQDSAASVGQTGLESQLLPELPEPQGGLPVEGGGDSSSLGGGGVDPRVLARRLAQSKYALQPEQPS